jgi:hypothetical protein
MAAKGPTKPAKTTSAAPAKSVKPGKPAVKPGGRAAQPPAQAVVRLVKESTAPGRGETKTLEAPGPCVLLGATVTMQGAPAGISQLGLEIDGNLVLLARADQLVAQALTVPNPAGVFATHASYGHHWTAVFGWPYPVHATGGVRLAITVLEDMAQLELALVVGRA